MTRIIAALALLALAPTVARADFYSSTLLKPSNPTTVWLNPTANYDWNGTAWIPHVPATGGGGTLPVGAATSANQNSTAAGTTATSAQAIQGVTGGVPVPVALSALPPLSAGTAAIGTVAVTALPALPAGANAIGSVSVSNLPATQAVSLATAPTTPVTGTFWQATQPVSLAVLPALPAGANAIGTVAVTALPALPAGANAIGTVAVTALPALPAGANAIGKVTTVPGVSVPSTQAAATVTAGGTFQTVLAANASRSTCGIQNTATHTAYVYWLGSGTAALTNAMQIAPGAIFNCSTGAGSVIQTAIQWTTSTTADPLVVTENQ